MPEQHFYQKGGGGQWIKKKCLQINCLCQQQQRPLWEHLLLVEFWAVWNRDNSPSYLVLSVWCVYLSTYLYFEVTSTYVVAHWQLCLAKLRSCNVFDSLEIGECVKIIRALYVYGMTERGTSMKIKFVTKLLHLMVYQQSCLLF